jgi:hypothetical protein
MLERGIRAGAAIVVLLVMASIASDAEARRRHSYYLPRGQVVDPNSDRFVDDERRGRRPSAFGITVAQLIRQCHLIGLELKGWPIDEIATSVSPDESQRALLEQVRAGAAQAADQLAANCPQQLPDAPADRLTTLRTGMQTAITALDGVQPSVQAFYASLSDEQKARLVARQVRASYATEPEPASRFRRRGRDRADAPAEQPNVAAICAQWAQALGSWPPDQVARRLRASGEQLKGLEDLTKAASQAAGTLSETCGGESPLTPVGRLEATKKRLNAIAEAAEALRPPLAAFVEGLSERQKTYFASFSFD